MSGIADSWTSFKCVSGLEVLNLQTNRYPKIVGSFGKFIFWESTTWRW